MLFSGPNFPSQIVSKISTVAPPNAKVKPVSVCNNSER